MATRSRNGELPLLWNVAAGPTINVGDIERAHDQVDVDAELERLQKRLGRAERR